MLSASYLPGMVFPALADLPQDSVVRITSFNTYLNRENEGQLIADLSTPNNPQAQAVAEIIQRINPDILLLNEFDHDPNGEAINLFQTNYLSIGQNGAPGIEFPYVYLAPSNTGIPSGLDLDNDGQVDTTPGDRSYGGDAYGFGAFPGQFAMVLLSKYPIITDQIRTFQRFLWADMPGALLPDNLDTPQPNDWFSSMELTQVRLSSKNHWDVPINVDGFVIHVLAAHPTPPVFDGPEDRNGNRNFDELRLWADYITPDGATYLYDDAMNYGGLQDDSSFVIMGDLNADPNDGDARPGAIAQLLEHPRVNTCITPTSQGAVADGKNQTHHGPPETDTSDFGDYGNYRLDYVLPSSNLKIQNAFVFWPTPDEQLYRLVGEGEPVVSSDHRAVVVDIYLPLDSGVSVIPANCNN
jgi:hypothetical protein